jgi:putative N6-adenine-specific DNA methylase
MEAIIKTIPGRNATNLDRRIKRHVIGARHSFFAVTLPGYEELCRQELKGMGSPPSLDPPVKGGVAFSGRLTDLYQANLHLRTAGRVLLRLADFKATGFNRLEKQIRELAWSLYLPPGAMARIHVTARHSRLYHTQAVARRIEQTLAVHWADLGIEPVPGEDQTLHVRLVDDRATLSLDSSGPNLYRRGLKIHPARAPLRETLAALILQIAGYRPDRPLVDPMCGAGTFSLEAALMAKHIPPGLHRSFAFMQWPAFRPAQWNHLCKAAGSRIKRLNRPLIRASDIDGAVCAKLAQCVTQNGLGDAIRVDTGDFFSLLPTEIADRPGLLVFNPPYGRRLRPDVAVGDLYRDIALKLRRDFKGWRAALLVPDRGLARSLNLPFKSHELRHGGLELTLLTGRL